MSARDAVGGAELRNQQAAGVAEFSVTADATTKYVMGRGFTAFRVEPRDFKAVLGSLESTINRSRIA
jgi:hypothetical protein